MPTGNGRFVIGLYRGINLSCEDQAVEARGTRVVLGIRGRIGIKVNWRLRESPGFYVSDWVRSWWDVRRRSNKS